VIWLTFAAPIDWDAIFELYLDPKFLRSIRRMSQFFFPETYGIQDNVDLIAPTESLINGTSRGTSGYVRRRSSSRFCASRRTALSIVYDTMIRWGAHLKLEKAIAPRR